MKFGISTRQTLLLVALAWPSSIALADGTVEPWRLQKLAGRSSVLDSNGDLLAFGGGSFTGGIYAFKVAPDGTVVWESPPLYLPGGHTVPTWIDVDADDNVILGGYHEALGGGFLAVKYDTDGNELWHSIVGFGVNPQARRVAVDEVGDVYLFGETWGGLSGSEPTGHDFLTVKLDSAGTFQWVKLAHQSGSDEPGGLDVRNGVVAVTGHANGPYMTVAYDYSGNLVWKRVYADGIWGGNDVVIGPTGQVVVCGWGTTNGNFPYTGTVLAYDSGGSVAWKVLYNGPTGGVDNFMRLAVNDAGDVAAAGWTSVGAYEDWSTLKIDVAGNLLWSAHFGGITSMSEWARAVAFGPAGEVYVGGDAGPSCTGIGTDGHVVKYAPDGTQEWVHHLSCAAQPAQLHVDGLGAIWYQGDWNTARILETIGTTYCSPATVNSTGDPGVTVVSGSSIVADQDFTLTAFQLPHGRFGYFLASETPGIFMPPASQGTLCLGGSVGRLNAQVIQGPSGSVPVDLTAMPVNPPTAVLPGATWHFQCWYRDDNPAPTSNFTDAVSVTFL